jgi:hypothetical protein
MMTRGSSVGLAASTNHTSSVVLEPDEIRMNASDRVRRTPMLNLTSSSRRTSTSFDAGWPKECR